MTGTPSVLGDWGKAGRAGDVSVEASGWQGKN